ncbi:hypothetical protein POTOM_002022 [Populus tomentosa]|uniref:Uncharacterized protein n=1 Tax=Populus tomentosa TaxID=118781 RepID=A0A8X8DJ52_POPTO|nr:hypothetical protein POTOM_002022 [Populus tomentosa]
MQNIFHQLIFLLFAKVDELFYFVALIQWDYFTWTVDIFTDTTIYSQPQRGPGPADLAMVQIGNAAIGDETDNQGMYDFFGTHALISYDNLHAGVWNAIDVYNTYGPLCLDGNLTSRPRKTSLMNFDPCSDYYVYAYLNRPDVQEAMHANVTKLTYDWEPRGDFNWVDSAATILPLLKELMENGLRVWLFSGDTDGRVPFTSTQYAINKMKLPIKTEWYPWFQGGEFQNNGRTGGTYGTKHPACESICNIDQSLPCSHTSSIVN